MIIEFTGEVKVTTIDDIPFDAEKVKKVDVESLSRSQNGSFQRLLKQHPGFLEFVDTHIGLHTLDASTAKVGDFPSTASLKIFKPQSLSAFANLCCFNDFRFLNKYLLEVGRKLQKGGIFIGRGETIDIHKSNFLKSGPKYWTLALYYLDFLYRRVLPKIPGLKKVYFAISKGRNRAFSKAEILGRLYFCGFTVLAVEKTEDDFFFIAQKDHKPSADKNPSYGFIIKLKRVGQNGEPIYIRKFRTMHPYSEYLQKYIFEHNKLLPNGKFKDDFRVTAWGKLMRKYWLDEFPQLINYFRGDINLVGVRALSEHYFSLYPKDLQALRRQFKPGLIPPYYADLPESFEEIIESERRYFARKQKHRYLTDDFYFWKAVANILLKNARSY